MYHDTVHIKVNNSNSRSANELLFSYSFLISKNRYDKFSPIKYGELLHKFEEIGFNLKYIKFYDIDEEDTIVYCTYNYQTNFNIFFTAYNKLLKNKRFDIDFEYGVMINGKFIPNNMNHFASIHFKDSNFVPGEFFEHVIAGKDHKKISEFYQVVNKSGEVIASELTNADTNFEQHFFEKYEVKVALRKYKLGRLKLQSET